MLPGWLALIEQVPMPTALTKLPRTQQTLGVMEPNLTTRPGAAVAAIGNGGTPAITPLSGRNTMLFTPLPLTVLSRTVIVPALSLIVERSSLPSPLKSPTTTEKGPFPTVNGLPAASVKPPRPSPFNTVTAPDVPDE